MNESNRTGARVTRPTRHTATRRHTLLVACLALGLAACGGGGGGAGGEATGGGGLGGGGSGGGGSGGSGSGGGAGMPQAPSAPSNLQAAAGHGHIVVSWDPVAGADGHHLYYAEEPGIVPANYASYAGGTWVQDASTPHTVDGLAHGATYYFVVTAYTGAVESPPVASVAATLPAQVANVATRAINDTGIDRCADADDVGLECPVHDYPRQDGEHGRDALAALGARKSGAGAAGFDYSKVSHDGVPLPPDADLGSDASDWACTLDHVTGLLWEVKTDDSSDSRYREHTYSWYVPDADVHGGAAGTQNGGDCQGSDCDTHAYAAAVNAQGLCGFDDWRLPTVGELLTLVHHGRAEPAIDTQYFPDVTAGQPLFWTGTAYAGDADRAWSVSFEDGVSVYPYKQAPLHVRVVRAGE